MDTLSERLAPTHTQLVFAFIVFLFAIFFMTSMTATSTKTSKSAPRSPHPVARWSIFLLQLLSRCLCFVLIIAFGYAGFAKQVGISKFMLEWYGYHLAPEFNRIVASYGLEYLKVEPEQLRNIVATFEMLIAFLYLFNHRKAASIGALLIILSGTKNVNGRAIALPLLGELFVYPAAAAQAGAACLILILPGSGNN